MGAKQLVSFSASFPVLSSVQLECFPVFLFQRVVVGGVVRQEDTRYKKVFKISKENDFKDSYT